MSTINTIATIFIILFQVTNKACGKYHSALSLPTWSLINMLEFSGSNTLWTVKSNSHAWHEFY